MRELLLLDKQAFYYINSVWQNPFFDTIMPLIRNSDLWVPLYIFLLVFAIVNFKNNVLIWCCTAGILVTLTNYISSDLIKEFVFRLRPCNDLLLEHPARLLLSYRPQSSSFTSSHATNHFAMAIFFHKTLKDHVGKWTLLFFLWAFIIIYAQVYVGVHFPIDVISGAFVGVFFGYLVALIFNKYFKLT